MISRFYCNHFLVSKFDIYSSLSALFVQPEFPQLFFGLVLQRNWELVRERFAEPPWRSPKTLSGPFYKSF